MLIEIGDDVYVWCGQGRLDAPNAGIVVEDDGLTVIDSLLVASQARDLLAALDRFGRPVRRLVLTSSHVPFVGGSTTFKLAAVYGSPTTSANLDLPPNIAGYQHLFPDHAREFDDLTARNVSHVVQQPAWLTQKVVAAPLPGLQDDNLVVQVPHANVVFAGATCSFEARPLGFEADFGAWLESLDQVAQWGALIVPGVGPIGDADDVASFAAYLAECLDAGTDGRAIAEGPWHAWAHAEFDAVNAERASMLKHGDTGPPRAALALFGMA
ncbi:MAG: MBL fold metallo-hydrolase [Actinobacteria bacterium]|uniref:Unannotated protein n=1 Tax=freshwater metagenome TaxID=449393 RepID=A0A6J7IW90_9ZZZZ|nr:MBL fold metallo-hydrolase [Actinomycetota bacterium]MSW92758.1 MBL fold metallo-hydrolase [Actinomycetota bacterium]MSX87844.1 MBL fold metallo-hydrolase [Actinomycetota bacterium]MSY72443.1 MBL fold metallo-hydrolase [Actinomycetota bacterium]